MTLFDGFRRGDSKKRAWNPQWDRMHALTAALIEEMVARGEDVNARDEYGNTPLHLAAGSGTPEIIRALLAHGADVNAQSQAGETPLHRAASGDRLAAAACLIVAGANVALCDGDGRTAAEHARSGMARLLRAVAEKSVDARDDNGVPPLVLAAAREQTEVCEALLFLGADPNAGSEDGATALYWSAYKDNLKLIRLLLEKGADANARNQKGNAPLHVAALENRAAAAKALIDGGADVNARNEHGRTPLHTAAGCQASKVAALLLESGADLGARNSEGRTALDVAEKYSPEVADLIRARSGPPTAAQVDLNRKIYGACPVCGGHLEPRNRPVEIAMDGRGGQLAKSIRVTDLFCPTCKQVIKQDYTREEERTREEMRRHFGLG